ncbi:MULTISPECIES: cell division protein FtsQ/DivIB [Bhargavaea]|uniref:Cell division protein DivIB n=1 Tax=Bhargavaea changchunensis TaxID=2134037 RepID=A0ABW2NCD8_9BACL|nr:cell division protein FtsQ/DivIB [Bhargavaea sp. CC-171006]
MDKVIDIEDRIPSLKERRRRRTNRNFIFLFVLFLLLLAVLLYFQSPLSKVREIRVEGAALQGEEEYIRASGIRKGDALWGFSAGEAERSVKGLKGVEGAEVIRKDFRDVVIRVDEFPIVAIIQGESGFNPVLADGSVFDRISDTPPPAPILADFGEAEQMKKMVKELEKLPASITSLISELKYTDNGSITAFMTDGYEVRGVISGFAEKMEYYPSIVAQLTEEGKGVIDLEAGVYFTSYEKIYGDGESESDGEGQGSPEGEPEEQEIEIP